MFNLWRFIDGKTRREKNVIQHRITDVFEPVYVFFLQVPSFYGMLQGISVYIKPQNISHVKTRQTWEHATSLLDNFLKSIKKIFKPDISSVQAFLSECQHEMCYTERDVGQNVLSVLFYIRATFFKGER
jgi:hypothetical protein